MRHLICPALAALFLISVPSLEAQDPATDAAATGASQTDTAPSALAPTDAEAEVVFDGPETVRIVTEEATHEISAEIARTDAQMQRGLMWRETLAPDAGMLFVYEPARRTSMWMENTLIPLDLVYIRPDGEISKIIAFAQPDSRRSLPSDSIVAGVLELAGGRAFELGIAPGDRVEHAAFGSAAPDVADDAGETSELPVEESGEQADEGDTGESAAQDAAEDTE